jgi:DNA primase
MNYFSYIKDQIQILEVIGSYTTLKQAGTYWKGCCPFHQEKTPSFTVSPNRGIFYCFGCHAGGDIITFMSKAEACTPYEATQLLIERFQLTIPAELSATQPAQQEQRFQEKKKHWHICQFITTWCHAQLLKHKPALEYLKQRQLHGTTLTAYTIGYFPSKSTALKHFISEAQKAHILAKDLLEIGFLAQGKSGLYSPFEERIIFPISDHLGRVCGFGGRIYAPQDERPKYYNSKESAYFTKGSLLFGFEQAKRSIQHSTHAILVEGYMDCITLHQFGHTNTIATLGTACTAEQLHILARYAQRLFIMYDGDTAGQQAMIRLAQLAWQVNIELAIVQLPEKQDPALFLTEGNPIAPLLENAKDIFSFFVSHLGTHFTTQSLQEKVLRTKRLLAIVVQIEDSLKKELLLQMAAKAFNVPLAILHRTLEQAFGPTKSAPEAAPACPSSPQPRLQEKTISELEKKLFSVILNNIVEMRNEKVEQLIAWFTEPLKGILNNALTIPGTTSKECLTHLLRTIPDEQKELISKLLVEYQAYDTSDTYQQLEQQFRKQYWKSMVNTFKLRLARAQQQHDQTLITQLLNDFQKERQALMNRGHDD